MNHISALAFASLSPQEQYAFTVRSTKAAFTDKAASISNRTETTVSNRTVTGRAEDLPIAETLRTFAPQFDNLSHAGRDVVLSDSAESAKTR